MSLSFGITLQVTPSCNLTGNLKCISTVSANIQINVIMNGIQCPSVAFSPHLSSCMHFAHPEEKVKNTLQDVQKFPFANKTFFCSLVLLTSQNQGGYCLVVVEFTCSAV